MAEAVEGSCSGNYSQRTNLVWPSHSIVDYIAGMHRSEHHADRIILGTGPYNVPVIADSQFSRRIIGWIDEGRQGLEAQ